MWLYSKIANKVLSGSLLRHCSADSSHAAKIGDSF